MVDAVTVRPKAELLLTYYSGELKEIMIETIRGAIMILTVMHTMMMEAFDADREALLDSFPQMASAVW